MGLWNSCPPTPLKLMFSKMIDLLCVMLLLAAGLAFCQGVVSLGDRHDLLAMYWLLIGGLLLRASTDMLRPAPRRS